MAKTQVDELLYCVEKCNPLAGDADKLWMPLKEKICLSKPFFIKNPALIKLPLKLLPNDERKL